MFEKWKRRAGKSLIFIGVILIIANVFLLFNKPEMNIGTLVISSMKSEISNNTTILLLAGVASWAIPFLLIFIGISIIKRSVREEI